MDKKLKILTIIGVTDLIYRTVQVLKKNLYWIRISTQDTKLIELVEL